MTSSSDGFEDVFCPQLSAEAGFGPFRGHVLYGGIDICLSHKLHQGWRLTVILNLATTHRPVLAAGHILDSERSGGHPRDMIFDAHHVLAGSNPRKTHFSPVFAPAVPDDPVLLLSIGILPIPRNGDDVIGAGGGGFVIEDTTRVIPKRVGINSRCHGSSGIYLSLDLVCPLGRVLEDIEQPTSNLSVFSD